MKFLPLYSSPNPFHRGWPGCWLNQVLDSKASNSMGEIWIYAWKFKIWHLISNDMGYVIFFHEPMDGDWEVLKEETCWSWWELYISKIDMTSFAIQKWAFTAHLRMMNGKTDMFLGSFSSNTLGSLTNPKRWYWNHSWTVSGGLGIKLGGPVEPPKMGWGPTNIGKHWFEPRLIGDFILCCLYVSMWAIYPNIKVQYIIKYYLCLMENHNWLISIRAGMMILANQPKDSECHSHVDIQIPHVTISPLVVPCSKVLALPLFAVSWALFNVWRVAFRQAGCLRIRNEEENMKKWKEMEGSTMFKQEKKWF